MADVNIKIDIDADTSAIDRVRLKLRSLCKEVDDCTGTYEKHTKAIRELSSAEEDGDRGRKNTGNGFNKNGKSANKLTGFLKKLAMFGFKYLAIEAAAALVVIASAGILFKTGELLARGYEMALSGVAYGMAAIVAAASVALAAMRQFQAVQFAPSFSEGAINTDDPMRAASAGMKMFIDDQQMAVIGTKGLTSAFKTLNDQQQITGKTTAVFRELSNYTAGMGGDMEKGSQSMAKFLAQFQKDKRMTEAVKEAGKELGPGFEKILKEANKLGLTSYEKFTEAALKGELGDTFKKYAGQLDTVNSTVIGKFKQGFSGLKNMLVEVGEPLLGPLTEKIPRIINIIEGLILTIRGNVQEIGSGSLLDGLVNGFEKVALWIGRIVNRDIGKAGKAVQDITNGFRGMMAFFEKIQDYLRPLVGAAAVLGRVTMELLKVFGGSLENKIQNLSDSLVNNEEKMKDFVAGFADFLTGFGKFGSAVASVFGTLLPGLSKFLTLLGDVFDFASKILVPINFIVKLIMGIAKALDFVLNPILTVVDKMTFGVVSFRNVVQSLTAAVLAFAAAMLVSKKARKFGKRFFSDSADDAMDGGGKKGRLGKLLKKGGLKKGAKALGSKVAGFGGKAANLGKMAFSGGSSSIAAIGAAGLAAAGAGYLSGGFVSDKLFNANTKMSRAGGALAGAGTGAAVGATIGSVIPGLGTAVGAIVGGIAGGIAGFISAGKERRKFDNIAKGILEDFSSSIDDAIKKGDTAALKEASEKANREYLEMLNGGKYGIQAYNAKLKELEAINKQANDAFANFTTFEIFFGDPDKLNKELEKQGKNADLVKNGIINIFDIMRQGGHDVASTWDTVMGEFNQKLLDARLAMFDLPLKTIEMQEKVNASQQALLEGDTTAKSVTGFLEDAFKYSLSRTNNDVTRATLHMRDTLEKVTGPNGSMNKVSDKLWEQADALQLFDPKVFAEQIIATGKTEAQGRTIETLTGGAVTAGQGNVLLQKYLYEGGPDAQAMIDKMLRLGVTGNLSSDQIMTALNDPQTMQSLVNTGTKTEIDRRNAQRRAGTTPTGSPAAANPGAVNIGGVSVNVSGFISDPAIAARIAKLVAAEIAKRNVRSGASTSPTSPSVEVRPTGAK